MIYPVDAVLLEILNNALNSIGDEMVAMMRRSARSVVARNGDCSPVLADADGEIIAQGHGAQFHMGYAKAVMPYVLAKWRARLKPGDIIAVNDPYQGLSHLPDIVLVAPAFWQGEVVAYVLIVAHQTDIGGRFPGGQGASSTEIFEEGLIVPNVRLYREDELDEDVLAFITANVRTPEDVAGDLAGQASACRRGVQGITELLQRYGRETFDECIARLKDYSENLVAEGIARVPEGTWTCEEYFEEDGQGGPGIMLKVSMRKDGDRLVADFTGTAPQVRSGINVPWGLTCSAVYLVCRYILAPEAPTNAGLFRRIEVICPEGTVLNPRFPGAVGARGMMLWRITDMLTLLFGKVLPDRAMADGEGGVSSLTYAAAIPGEAPSVYLDWYFGGWGARAGKDGVDGAPALASGGNGVGDSIEVAETEFPLVIEHQRFLPDTGGIGRYRGALSLSRRFRFLADGRVLMRTSRSQSLPHGLHGGGDGTPFFATLDGTEGSSELPKSMFIDITVKAGDAITHALPGAAGYGEARERDPALVLKDVREGKMSREAAARDYGVVIAEGGSAIDEAATARARDAMRERMQ